MFMNGAFFHLALNHVPVLLPLVGILIIAGSFLVRGKQIQAIGLSLLIAGAVMAYPVYFSGSAARDVVQNYPNVTSGTIEEHRTASLYALVSLSIVGVYAAFTLWTLRRRDEIPPRELVGLLLLALMSTAILTRTAHLGGLIRHEELENGHIH